jgi:hypothetical protein
MKIRQSLKYILDFSVRPSGNINQDDTKSHKELTMSTFWVIFSHIVAKKLLANAKGNDGKKLLSEKFIRVLSKLWLLWSAPEALFYFRFHFIIALLLSPHFGDIFSSFLSSKILRERYRQLLSFIEHLSRNTSNYILLSLLVIVPACFHLPAAYLHLHFKASHCVRAGDQRKIFFPRLFFRGEREGEGIDRQTISLYPLRVKLNGNYFPLTIQRW